MQKEIVRNAKALTVKIVLLLFVLLFTVKSDVCFSGAYRGIAFCLKTVFPAVFPFCVMCKLLVYSNAFYGRGISFLGAVCPTPCCAVLICDMYKNGKIDKKSAEALISYTSNQSPTFILGFVGAYALSSVYKGLAVYLICLFCAYLFGSFFKKDIPKCGSDISFLPTSFVDAVTDSVKSVLFVCGYVIIFSVVCEFLKTYVHHKTAVFFLSIFLEITTGISNAELVKGIISERLLFSVLSFFTMFSGLCSHLQVVSYLHGVSLSCKTYFFGKAVQSITAFISAYVVYGIIFR